MSLSKLPDLPPPTPPDSADRHVLATGATPHGSRLRYTRWGIFEVAYVASPWWPKFSYCLSVTQDLSSSVASAAQLFRDLFSIAPLALITYLAASIWLSLAPGLSLYVFSIILSITEDRFSRHNTDDRSATLLLELTLMYLSCAGLSAVVTRVLDEMRLVLCGHLRAHLLPQLAEASLRANSNEDNRNVSFPNPNNFEDEAPGWSVVEILCRKARNAFTLIVQIFVLVVIIWHKADTDRRVLIAICATQLLLMFIVPTNGVGGGGYAFWTHNALFHRLQTLYMMIFMPKYRDDIAKDAIAEYLLQEYKETSKELGVVNASVGILAINFPRHWIWDIASDLVLEHPAAAYVLTLPWSLTSSSLATIALLQQASATLRQSILIYSSDSTPLPAVLLRAKKLYATLSVDYAVSQGWAPYPNAVTSDSKGMRISFKNVSLQYPQQRERSIQALRNVSFEILPGQLVLVVGTNGSGKSTLVKLLARLIEPTAGAILIDGAPIHEYKLPQLRAATAILAQAQELYPVSLSANIAFGLPGGVGLGPDVVADAARLGGADGLLQRLGGETILRPVPRCGTSYEGCGNGAVPAAAVDELVRQQGSMMETPISEGEKQRLAASRIFMRIANSPIRLLVLDEPASALDAVVERDLQERFLAQPEKTVVVVTHRLGTLAARADLILCMDSGHLVEKGTHAELLRIEGGHYAKLYNAQASGYTQGS